MEGESVSFDKNVGRTRFHLFFIAMKFRQLAKSTPLPEQNYFTEIILFLALPNNLIIHINILTRLNLHHLEQRLSPYRMERAA